MVRLVARFIAMFVPSKRGRRALRNKITFWAFAKEARRRARSFGEGLLATGKCVLMGITEVGEHTLLGGVVVLGAGVVKFGNHVSTGPGILIQTQSHDYNAESIPYSLTAYKVKFVTVDDCAWLGMNVTLLFKFKGYQQ